jgi:hypothetical protein
MADERFGTAVIGAGFVLRFFLREYLHVPPIKRVLVAEKGQRPPDAWKVANRDNTDFNFYPAIVDRTPQKPSIQSLEHRMGVGGKA